MNWLLTPLPPNFDAALRDVAAQRPESRIAAAERLGRAEDEQRAPALAGLVKLVRDAHPGVRATALAALGLIGSEREVDVIVAALADPAPEVREFAALAAAQIGGERALACLRKELTNAAPEVRFQAVAGVAELAPDDAASWLVPLLGDSDGEVRAQVVRALGSLDAHPSVGHLAGALDDSLSEVRIEAALALAQLRDARAEPVLLDALDRRHRVAEVARGLARLRSQNAREPIARIATAWFAAPHLRAELGAALVELDDPRGSELLRRVLTGLRSDARGYAVELAGEVSAIAVVPELVALLSRPRGVDPLTVVAALDRLREHSPAARSALQALAQRGGPLSQAASHALELAAEDAAEP